MRFTATLIARGPGLAWTKLDVPFDVAAHFGTKGRVPVVGTMNGFAFRTSLMPTGDGAHEMSVNKTMLAGAGARAGDVVEVVLERDEAERTVEVPDELAVALRAVAGARARFDALAVSHRKEYAQWVAGAKRPETRTARAAKAAAMVAAGTKRPN